MKKPYSGSEPYIFISYAHLDYAEVIPTVTKLQNDGYRVWYDEDIDPGTEWDENIARHVNACGYFIAFISRNYLASDNCKDELNYARDLGKSRLLIYIEDVTLPHGMAMRNNRLQAIHKYKYKSDADFYEKLRDAEGIDVCLDSADIEETLDESDFAEVNAYRELAALHPDAYEIKYAESCVDIGICCIQADGGTSFAHLCRALDLFDAALEIYSRRIGEEPEYYSEQLLKIGTAYLYTGKSCKYINKLTDSISDRIKDAISNKLFFVFVRLLESYRTQYAHFWVEFAVTLADLDDFNGVKGDWRKNAEAIAKKYSDSNERCRELLKKFRDGTY